MEMKTYTGGCHCGAVRYQVTTELAKVMECNCSICSKRGHLLTFVPAEQFKLLQGAEAMTVYQFGKKHIEHRFCKVCGISSFNQGKTRSGAEMRAVNVRCFDEVDLAALTITKVDGRSL
jgi:hypothetical protein